MDLGTGTVTSIALDSNTSLPATVHDSTGGICANALLGVRYTVMYDATDATVGAISAKVLLGNVSAATAGTVLNLDQEYTVDFMWSDSSAPTGSKALPQAQNRSLSGNPGYIVGRPVLAGTVHEYDVVVNSETSTQSIIDAFAEAFAYLSSMPMGAALQAALALGAGTANLFGHAQRSTLSLTQLMK